MYIDSEFVLILGVKIHRVTMQSALAILHEFLYEPTFHFVCTPNNEIVLKAHHDPVFLRILHSADLSLPDSTGLLLAAKLTNQYLPERVTGIDTMQMFCNVLTRETPIFLLGAKPGIAAKAGAKLQMHNPQLHIAGTYSGSPAPGEAVEICRLITSSGAKVLFVAFGAPNQETWLHTYKHLLPVVRIGMGVGGSFDFIAGTVIRAPVYFRLLYLEWFWRLLQEPKRLPRIWNATVVFILYVLYYGKK